MKSKRENQLVAIIGLGYVGLPLALLCKKGGYAVLGIDCDPEKLKKIKKGENLIKDKEIEKDLARYKINLAKDVKKMKKAKIIVVCVPTPVDESYYPDFGPLKKACVDIKNNLQKNQLIIIESTIGPGTMEEIVRPILERSGLKAGKDFYLAHCPERIDPGNKKWKINNIPRVAGAFSRKGLNATISFYRSIISGDIKPMSSVREAEAVKIVENAFRDVNIAFVNELARSFKKLGIDAKEVIEGASTKPFGFLPHYPGCGVGGHCIPVDPYYLIEKARKNGFDHEFLKLARKINSAMPEFTVELMKEVLNELELAIKGTQIGVLGVAYKKDIGDIRESPALKVIQLLSDQGAKLSIFDPFLPEYSTEKSINSLLEKVRIIVLTTDHTIFQNIAPQKLKRYKILAVIDGKNIWDKEEFKKTGILYRGIGRE